MRDRVGMSDRERAMMSHPAGKSIPESAEVAEARMDAEAVALANSGQKGQRVPDWVWGAALGVVLYLLLTAVGFMGAVVSGWPL